MKSKMLSPLEKTCLRWVSMGKTHAEIALLEGKSFTEIERCLERAVVMLDAKSVEEAIVKVNGSRSTLSSQLNLRAASDVPHWFEDPE